MPVERKTVNISLSSTIKLADPQACQFSWRDMQALHHFLVFCPPPLPIGNHDVWTRMIPQQAQQHPCLMSAILSLGASHLSCLTSCQSLHNQAVCLRGPALRGLEELLARSDSWSIHDTDAALATCYALTFQASYMLDGMDDYLVMVGGCALLTDHVRQHNLPTTFDISLRRTQAKLETTTAPILRGVIYQDLIDEATDAFDILETSVIDPAEYAFFSSARMILSTFHEGACTGVLAGLDLYGLWHHFASRHLSALTRQNSAISQVVLAYFVTMQIIFRVILPYRWFPDLVRQHPPRRPLCELLQWLDALRQAIPLHHQHHLEWTRSILARLPPALRSRDDIQGVILLRPLTKQAYLGKMSQYAHIVLGDVLRASAELATWFETLLQRRIDYIVEASKSKDVVHDESVSGQIELLEQSLVPHAKLPQKVAMMNEYMRNNLYEHDMGGFNVPSGGFGVGISAMYNVI